MSYTFDLAAAVNAIAAIEDAITTPTPGIVKSYTYGANPTEFTAGTQLPAIVHIPTGLVAAAASEITHGGYILYYDIYSLLLAIEAVPDQYPNDDNAANLFWKSVTEALITNTTRRSLCTATGAFDYTCIFGAKSYEIRPWPPSPVPVNYFWSLLYTHRFSIYGG